MQIIICICSRIILSVTRQPCCFWHEQPQSGGVTGWSGVWHQLWRSSLTDQPARTRCAACERAAGAVFVWPHPCGRGLQGDHPHDSTVSAAACWTPLSLFTTCWTPLSLFTACSTPLSLFNTCSTPLSLFTACSTPLSLFTACSTPLSLFTTQHGLNLLYYYHNNSSIYAAHNLVWWHYSIHNLHRQLKQIRKGDFRGGGGSNYWWWARCCLFSTDNGLGVVCSLLTMG